ncbi:hypothetical protein [Rhizobium sp. YK2]|uniref:ORC-CDC6 family AAA ATPase n=1 Tax=Rhizobium sp. YK2 TaxID=1860096 RepID=UPI00084BCDC5|nr:hypothetical protein [Rhizobium sp. YK2]OED00954.1 hypothetical protein A9Z06_13535 [Rhizobium sp. YK2]
MKSNPFFELYVGDRISPKDFATIFSDFLVPHAEPLFLQGHAVVTGIQGSGKSMLLQLLQPSIRIQYEQSGKDFPVPIDRRKFLGASVNLAHSNAIDFGLRRDLENEPREVELLFGDFFNYLVVASFIQTVDTIAKSSNDLRREVGLNVAGNEVNDIAVLISKLDIWEGWIQPCANLAELQKELARRIQGYRRYLHMKDRVLSPSFKETRTPVGVPILDCVDALQRGGIIDVDSNIFVNVDQYEELGNISSRKGEDAPDYRSVINRALANRDPRVSYRIGTRGHAWRRHSRIMGTEAKLEQERDYKYVDLDILLKRNESGRNDIFPMFARDVFRRRLAFAGFTEGALSESDALRRVYGTTPKPADKVKQYGLREPEAALRFDSTFSEETKAVLRRLAQKGELLSAKLGEIWIKQKGDKFDLNVLDKDLPWEKSLWWRKERREVVALQIASQTQQKALWGGAEDLVGLSGGNILVFLSLNQFIWDSWIQSKGRDYATYEELPRIDLHQQSVGVNQASRFWVDKIRQETGRSGDRSRFVFTVAEVLSKKIYGDIKLSNPGHTGFSVLFEELESIPEVQTFLEELSDYGNFLMLDHTTKNHDRKTRVKFYFHPIFCPRFDLPYIRTKEPYYASIKEVVGWIHNAGSKISLGNRGTKSAQAELF